MPTENESRYRCCIVTFLSLLVLVGLGSGLAGGQQDQNANIQMELVEAPDTVELGETAIFRVRATLPTTYDEGHLVSLYTVSNYADSLKLIRLEPGESKTVSITVNYSQPQTREVTIAANVLNEGSERDETLSTQVVVGESNSTIPSVPDGESELTDQSQTYQGVSIPIAAEAQQNLRSKLPGSSVTPGSNLFFLASEESLQLVVSNNEPVAGQATVQGTTVAQVRSPDTGEELTVLRARSSTSTTEGQQVSAQGLANSSEQYHLRLVRTNGYHNQVSMRFDPDQGSNITRPTTTGYFSPEPPTDSSGVAINYYDQIERLRNTSIELSQSYGEQSGPELSSAQTYYPPSPSFATYSPSSTFWATRNHTIDAIFIDPESTDWDSPIRRALRMARPADQADQFQLDGYLYVVNSGPTPGTEATIQNIRDRPEQYQGQTVTIEGYFGGQKMSVQELIEHNTPCGQDYAQVPSSGGPSCVDLVIDSVVYSGVIASDDVSSGSDIMPVIGFSGEHQDTQQTTISGRYQLTGRVIQVGDISEKLPGTTALVIYDAESDRDDSTSQGDLIENGRERLQQTVKAILLNEDVPDSVSQSSNLGQTQAQRTESTVYQGMTTTSTSRPPNQEGSSPLEFLYFLHPMTVVGAITWSGIFLIGSLVLLIKFTRQTIDKYF